MSTLDVITPSPVSPLRMTEDEYAAWATEGTDAEWVRGEVRFKVSIDLLHDELQFAVKGSLVEIVRRNALGRVLGDRFAMRLANVPSRREPDVMFIANENPSPLSRTLLDGPCDLAVEIVSPSSFNDDYSYKFVEYQSAGVREYWIVDPMRKAIVAYRRDDAGTYVPLIADEQNRLNSLVIPSWRLGAAELFREPTPTPNELAQLLGIV